MPTVLVAAIDRHLSCSRNPSDVLAPVPGRIHFRYSLLTILLAVVVVAILSAIAMRSGTMRPVNLLPLLSGASIRVLTWAMLLAQLVPKYLPSVLVDAFDPDGSLIRYALRDDVTFRIDCVGPNKVDDGGQPPPDSSQRVYPGDFVLDAIVLDDTIAP